MVTQKKDKCSESSSYLVPNIQLISKAKANIGSTCHDILPISLDIMTGTKLQ